MSKNRRHPVPHRGSVSILLGKVARRSIISGIGIAFALGAVAVVAGAFSTGPTPASASNGLAASAVAPKIVVGSSRQERIKAAKVQTASLATFGLAGKDARRKALAVTADGCNGICAKPAALVALSKKSGRHWLDVIASPDAAFVADPSRKARFQRVVREAALSPEIVADAFENAGMAVVRTDEAVAVAVPNPASERFAAQASLMGHAPSLALAYADPSPTAAAADALSALSEPSLEDEGALAPADNEDNDADGTALSPEYEDTPDDSVVPLSRPRLKKDDQRADEDEKRPSRTKKADIETSKPDEKAKKPATQKLAFARPDSPIARPERGESGVGKGLKNLFARPRAGRGVAVYDISAAKVYMPDGSVLEAHSGIGKMADNPRYTHVKMNGPTPPHTYNLKMREKRFHGVEAIRMLPVDGKNKHGRDGFLTHSYLLRGGRAESHGCVAFKDYKKFLNAFKQGKIKQLVVVPGGGRAIARGGGGKPTVREARNGRDA